MRFVKVIEISGNSSEGSKVRFVVCSDTHNEHEVMDIPNGGDVPSNRSSILMI